MERDPRSLQNPYFYAFLYEHFTWNYVIMQSDYWNPKRSKCLGQFFYSKVFIDQNVASVAYGCLLFLAQDHCSALSTADLE